MKPSRLLDLLAFGAFLLAALPSLAADHPPAQGGGLRHRELPLPHRRGPAEVKLHYRTVGDPAGEPVLVLHGTAGSGASMLSRAR